MQKAWEELKYAERSQALRAARQSGIRVAYRPVACCRGDVRVALHHKNVRTGDSSKIGKALFMKFVKPILFSMFFILCAARVVTSAEVEPLKLAVIAPVLDWDNPSEIEVFVDGLQEKYNIEVTWIEPELPPEGEEAKKEYYRDPPAIDGLKQAWDADVIYTALTHVKLNVADSEMYLKLLMSKPIVAGKRAHHGLNLSRTKDSDLPEIMLKGLGKTQVEKPQTRWAMAAFGCVMGGHHGGKVNIKEGLEDHEIVKGLDGLLAHRMAKRGYKYKQMADDVTVLVESEGMPQVWVRDKQPNVERRLFYVGYDPVDFEKISELREMITRAIFWVANRNSSDFRRKQ